VNNTVKSDFFGFSKVKWLYLTGEVDKSVRLLCQIFSEFNMPKIIKIGYFLTQLFKKLKSWTFLQTQCICAMLFICCCRHCCLWQREMTKESVSDSTYQKLN